MSESRRRYIRECFENNKGWIQIDSSTRHLLVENVLNLADENFPLPPKKFFDLQHTTQKVANEKRITVNEARTLIITDPKLLFETHQAPYDFRKTVVTAFFTPVARPKPALHDFAFTKEDILASAFETLAETGHRPNRRSGKILYGPLADGIKVWQFVDTALMSEMPSLKGIKEKSLHEFFDRNDVPLRAKGISKAPLTLDLIERSVRETLKATGRRPVCDDGMVLHGPLAHQETWNGIDVAFMHQTRGLKGCGHKSLPRFMDAKNIAADQTLRGTPRNTEINIADIQLSIMATFEHTGRRPTKNDGIVEHGPLAGIERWHNIDAAFKRGNRGLKQCGFDSLKAYMNYLDLPENIQEHRYDRKSLKPPIALDDIFLSLKETYLATGKRPIADGTMIAYGPLKDMMTWSSLNGTISGGRRGLKDCGYANLKEITASMDLKGLTIEPAKALAFCKSYQMAAEFRYNLDSLADLYNGSASAACRNAFSSPVNDPYHMTIRFKRSYG